MWNMYEYVHMNKSTNKMHRFLKSNSIELNDLSLNCMVMVELLEPMKQVLKRMKYDLFILTDPTGNSFFLDFT